MTQEPAEHVCPECGAEERCDCDVPCIGCEGTGTRPDYMEPGYEHMCGLCNGTGRAHARSTL